MSAELVERVALAIERFEAGWLLETGLVNPSGKDYRMGKGRAAIEAMRDPPEAVLDALNKMAQCEGYLDEGWNDAIDAALGKS